MKTWVKRYAVFTAVQWAIVILIGLLHLLGRTP